MRRVYASVYVRVLELLSQNFLVRRLGCLKAAKERLLLIKQIRLTKLTCSEAHGCVSNCIVTAMILRMIIRPDETVFGLQGMAYMELQFNSYINLVCKNFPMSLVKFLRTSERCAPNHEGLSAFYWITLELFKLHKLSNQ